MAASNLASLPEIRAAVAPRIMPDAAQALSAKKQAARELGIKLAQSTRVKVARVLTVVTKGDKILEQKLVDLFNKTDLKSTEEPRKNFENLTDVKKLETRLTIDTATLDTLTAQL
jgi:hypothetical protein